MPRDLSPGERVAEKYQIERAIDQPRGSQARVYQAKDLETGEHIALKVLRYEYLDKPKPELEDMYERFQREALLLSMLQDNPHVMKLYGVGYLWEQSTDKSNSYQLKSFGHNIDHFRESQVEAIANGWRPYLTLEPLPENNSLHRRVFRAKRLPMIEAIEFSLQLTGLLVQLHQQDIIYWDAKPAHAYWDWNKKHLVLIDWNISFLLTRLGEEERLETFRSKDLDEIKKLDVLIAGRQFIYPAFVGRDFHSGIPLSSEGTTSASRVLDQHGFNYRGEVDLWGRERQLDRPIQEFLKRVVQSDEFPTAKDLRQSLEECAVLFGWDFSERGTKKRDAEALEYKLEALGILRQAIESAAGKLEAAYQRGRLGADTRYLMERVSDLLED